MTHHGTLHRTLHHGTLHHGQRLGWRRHAAACCLLLVLLICGCGGQERVPVHGQVLYEGRPLEYGSVMLQPIGGGEIVRATIQPDGTFELASPDGSSGAAPGRYLVRVTAFEAQRAQSQGPSNREPALGRSAIPKKYASFRTSGLEIEIAPGMELPLVLDLDNPSGSQ